MLDLALDADSLMFENAVLARALGDSQRRCADALARGALQVRRLEAQVLRLRAEVVIRATALAWVVRGQRVNGVVVAPGAIDLCAGKTQEST